MAAIILSIIFLSISAIHFYWAIGGKWGVNAAIPTTNEGKAPFQPGIIPTLIVGFGLLGFALVALGNLGIFDAFLSKKWINCATYAIVAIFTLRGIGDFKYVGLGRKIKNTNFAKYDKRYFTPLCFLIALLALIALK
jgi:Protein of unknown function (DUF3995)